MSLTIGLCERAVHAGQRHVQRLLSRSAVLEHTFCSSWHVHLALAAESAVSFVDKRNSQDLGRSISDNSGSMTQWGSLNCCSTGKQNV